MFLGARILLASALALAAAAAEPERVRIQLNWFHQFQFAGLYAADHRGYFTDEGLRVEIAEFAPGIDVLANVRQGLAQFAITDSRIVEAWAHGHDLGLVAVLLQRNPTVLLVHADSPCLTLADLFADPQARVIGPTIPLDPELRVAITALGRDPATAFLRAKRPDDLQAFARRDIDAIHGYLTNEPHRLAALGVETRGLRHNIDGRSPFFGSALICSGDLLRGRPDLVSRVRRAVLRGWGWALDHQAEMAQLITQRWPSSVQPADAAQLLAEAAGVDALIDREVIPLGTIGPARLEAMAGMLRSAGQPGLVRSDLVWQDQPDHLPWLRVLGWTIGLLAIACLVLVAIAWAIRRRLISTSLSEQRLMDLAEAFFLFHAVADGPTRLRLLRASPSMSAILGGSRGSYLADPDAVLRQVVDEDRQGLVVALAGAIAARQGLRHRFRIRHPEHATPRHLLLHAVPLPGSQPTEYDGLVLDLTAEAEAAEALLEVQRRLQTAQRNESLGLLAGGVAHDFNNLLGAIRGNAEMALNRLPDGNEAKPRVERVVQAADRAAGLVRQILAYAGKGSVELRPIDLGEECRVLSDLLRHAVPAQTIIRLDVEPGLPPVLFDPAQLQQVLVNLIVNAAESYGGAAGTVSIRIARAGDRVVIAIEDHGCGMDERTQARMFEPYFTTKPTGHGLGLAAVQGIVNALGATLTCRSMPGRGTTFTIAIPCTSGGQAPTRLLESPRPVAGRHLLLADDDELLRETVAQMARELGYTVDVAAGGIEAAELLADSSRPYVAAILDCAMPDRDGTEVVRTLRIAGDRRPMVLISGMVESARIGTGILDRRTRYLAKPFSKAMLDRTLRILLRSGTDDESSSDSTFASMQRESSVQMAIRRKELPPGD